MSELAVVTSKKTVETVNDDEIILPTGKEMKKLVSDAEADIVAMFTPAANIDPSLKKCPRCVKKGRFPFHKLEDFSVNARTGKPHCYCKACKSEASGEWTTLKYKHRQVYQKKYREENKERLQAYAHSRMSEPTVEPTKERDDILFVAGHK